MGRNCIVRGISRFSLPNCLKRHFVQCIQKQHSHIHFKKMLKQWCYKKNSDCSTKQLSGNWTQREGEKDKEWAREQGRTKTLMPAIVRTYGPDNTWNILKHYINRLAAIPTIPPKKSARVSWKRGAEIHWDPLSSELHTEPRSFLHWPLRKLRVSSETVLNIVFHNIQTAFLLLGTKNDAVCLRVSTGSGGNPWCFFPSCMRRSPVNWIAIAPLTVVNVTELVPEPRKRCGTSHQQGPAGAIVDLSQAARNFN